MSELDYYGQLLFEDGALVAAVLQDDYTGWYDLKTMQQGSNLADVNGPIESWDEFITGYLTSMKTWEQFHVETNDIVAAEKYLRERGFTDDDLAVTVVNHEITIEEVARLVTYWQKEWAFIEEDEAEGD
jgi:hypothetical protein